MRPSSRRCSPPATANAVGRLRHLELRALYEAVGFEVLRFDANWLAEDAYLDDFVPRLRAAPSRYRDTARETLRVISGRLFLRKPEVH